MLEQLDIRDYALIDHSIIHFKPGLTVLTGETGAGKSIIAGALGLLLGFKGDTGMIRTDSEKTEVSGRINVLGSAEAVERLKDLGIETEEDGTILIRRQLTAKGKGSTYIQSSQVTRLQLLEFMSFLFDIHGQHEHQSLLVLENHRRLLDRYGSMEDDVDVLAENFKELALLKKEYETLSSKEKGRLREIDLLTFSINEIEKAALLQGEEETLVTEKKILSQSEKLFSLLDLTYGRTSEGRGGALSPLREAKDALSEGAEIDPSLNSLKERIENAFFEIEDVADSIRNYSRGIDYSTERLEACEERLSLIHILEKKYGNSIPEILSYKKEMEKKLTELENWEVSKDTLQERIFELEKKVTRLGNGLSQKRKKAASELESKIEKVLHDLGMPKAAFSVSITNTLTNSGVPVCRSYGFDTVEFLISPNQGEKLKKLRNIASGGEISRIMLAIKSILARSDRVQSLIFDEIDSGIGGEVALAIGEHLSALSLEKQILCITHLAAIAVRGNNHIKIEKKIYDNRTITGLKILHGDERIREISRMLAGDTDGTTSLTHAEELLKRYNAQ